MKMTHMDELFELLTKELKRADNGRLTVTMSLTWWAALAEEMRDLINQVEEADAKCERLMDDMPRCHINPDYGP